MDKNTTQTSGIKSVSTCPHGIFYNGEVCSKCAESFKEAEARKHLDKKLDKMIELLEKLLSTQSDSKEYLKKEEHEV